MVVKLLHSTPLWIASKAIRKCWASEDRSDSGYNTCQSCGEVSTWDRIDYAEYETCDTCGFCRPIDFEIVTGNKDKELIHRVGNKNRHSSTLEHLNYTFDIDGISRACLQELARHRMASISVKSTRYTLKELKSSSLETEELVSKFVVLPPNDSKVWRRMKKLLEYVQMELCIKGNDLAKYLLPEAYKTSLVWTVNARALQNFLSLRTDRSALWEIQDLAHMIYKELPDEHKYLFEEFVKERITNDTTNT